MILSTLDAEGGVKRENGGREGVEIESNCQN